MVHQRVNWSSGEPLIRLTAAVQDWLGKKGQYLLEDFFSVSYHGMKRYCFCVAIPFETFRKYVCEDEGKRRVLGRGVGPSRGVGPGALARREAQQVQPQREANRWQLATAEAVAAEAVKRAVERVERSSHAPCSSVAVASPLEGAAARAQALQARVHALASQSISDRDLLRELSGALNFWCQ